MDYVLSSPVATLPYQILSYYPFWSRHLRFSKRKTFLILSLLFLVKCVCFYYFVPQPLSPRLMEFLFGAVHLLVFLSMTGLHPGKALFVFFFLLTYLALNRGIASFMQVRFTRLPDSGLYGYSNGLLHLAVLAVTVSPILLLFRQTCHEIAETKEKYIISHFWVIPALSLGTSFVYSVKITPEAAGSLSFLISRLFLFLCTLTEYIVLIRSLQAARSHAQLEAQAENNKLLAAIHQEQYALLLKRIEETRRARHDLRQHLTLIQSYLDNGDKDALKEYVHAYGQSIPESVGIFIYCKNYAIDTIARFYLSQAEDEGIQVNVSLPLPKQLPIPEPDVCILLGNLLENALTACREMTSSKNRYIKICGLFTPPHTLSFTVDNSFQQQQLFVQNDSPFSASANYDHPGLGLGLSSVQSTAARFKGTAKFETTETEFRASVFLFGKDNPSDEAIPQ